MNLRFFEGFALVGAILLGAACTQVRPVSSVTLGECTIEEPSAQRRDVETIPLSATVSVVELCERALSSISLSGYEREWQQAIQAAELRQAAAWDNPSLTVGRGRFSPRDADQPTRDTWDLELSQRVELPWKRSARLKTAAAGTKVAQAETEAARLETEVQVRLAAVEYAVAFEARAKAQEDVAITVQLCEDAQRRHALSDSSKADLLDVQSEKILATVNLSTRAAKLEQAREVLRVAIGGLRIPQDLRIQDALPDSFSVTDIKAILAVAQANHPSMKAALAQMQQNEIAMHHENLAWQPDLVVGLRQAQEADGKSTGISLGIEFPLWNWNGGGRDLVKAKAGKNRIHLWRRGLQLEQEIKNAWSTLSDARVRSATLTHLLEQQATEGLRLRLLSYAAGQESMSSVLAARRRLVTLHQEVLEARRSTALAAIELGRVSTVFLQSTSQPINPGKQQP